MFKETNYVALKKGRNLIYYGVLNSITIFKRQYKPLISTRLKKNTQRTKIQFFRMTVIIQNN